MEDFEEEIGLNYDEEKPEVKEFQFKLEDRKHEWKPINQVYEEISLDIHQEFFHISSNYPRELESIVAKSSPKILEHFKEFDENSKNDYYFDSGPQNITENSSPFQVFSKIFPPSLVQDLSEELTCVILSNPIRKKEGHLVVESHLIYGFFSLILETSLNHCKNLKHYNRENAFFQNIQISNNTWLKLVSALYNISDEFFQLMENTIISKFNEFYYPDKSLSLGPLYRPFRGLWGNEETNSKQDGKLLLIYNCLVDKNNYLLWFKLQQPNSLPIQDYLTQFASFHPNIPFHFAAGSPYTSLDLINSILFHNWDISIGMKANSSKQLLDAIQMKLKDALFKEKLVTLGFWNDKAWFYHVSPIPEKVDEDKKLASEARKAEILFTYSSQAIDSVYQFNEVLKEADWKHRNPSWRSSHFQNLFRFVLINSWNLWKSVQINEEKKESEEEEKKEKKLALNGTSFNSFLQKLH